jgi:hypothetical protein
LHPLSSSEKARISQKSDWDEWGDWKELGGEHWEVIEAEHRES